MIRWTGGSFSRSVHCGGLHKSPLDSRCLFGICVGDVKEDGVARTAKERGSDLVGARLEEIVWRPYVSKSDDEGELEVRTVISSCLPEWEPSNPAIGAIGSCLAVCLRNVSHASAFYWSLTRRLFGALHNSSFVYSVDMQIRGLVPPSPPVASHLASAHHRPI